MLLGTSLVSLLLACSKTFAVTHEVFVGADGLKYEPEMVKAELGDIVNFVFQGGNHTVTQSTFAAPCINSGFKSGFRPAANTSANTFAIMINSTEPIWVYCAQGQHCQNGMVMAINAEDSGERSFAAYRALAMGSNGLSQAGTISAAGATGSVTTTDSDQVATTATLSTGGSTSPQPSNATSNVGSAPSASASDGAERIKTTMIGSGILAFICLLLT